MNAVLLLKASLLLSAVLLAARAFPEATASTRHRVWTAVFLALLALPLLARALPGVSVPVPAGWAPAPPSIGQPAEDLPQPGRAMAVGARTKGAGASSARAGSQASIAEPSQTASRIAAPAPAAGQPASAPRGWDDVGGSMLVAAWGAGAAAAAARLLLSLVRARRLAGSAEPVTDEEWQRAAQALGSDLGLRRPVRVVFSPRVGMPMAGGTWQPTVFVPHSARHWSQERREVVLAHEIAHLAGRDPLRHVVARLAVALYWFHPLAWLAARQAAVAREQACDEAVLALGRTRPSVYARVLLELADALAPSPAGVAALPMIQRSLLEARVMAILNSGGRPAPRRFMLIPVVGTALLTLGVAALRPAAPVAAREDGRPTVKAEGTVASLAAAPSSVRFPIFAPMASQPAMQAPRGDSACWAEYDEGSSFSGSSSTTEVRGQTIIQERVGIRDHTTRIIQKSFGDLHLCMVADGAGEAETEDRPSQWLGRLPRVVLEARRGGALQRLEVSRDAGGSQRVSWRVGSAERPFDAAAREWRDRMLAVLDTTWDLSVLRGKVSTSRGEISTIRGQESTLRGEISTLRGEVSTMRGHASTVRGEASTLRGQISTIHGHVSSLRGAISSEQGAISSLRSTYNPSESERARIDSTVAQHEAQIARLNKEISDYNAEGKIADVERQLKALDEDGKVAAIDAEIRAFDLDGMVAAVERRIVELDVQGKVAAIERQIAGLDAERRGREMEQRRESQLKALETAIAAIR